MRDILLAARALLLVKADPPDELGARRGANLDQAGRDYWERNVKLPEPAGPDDTFQDMRARAPLGYRVFAAKWPANDRGNADVLGVRGRRERATAPGAREWLAGLRRR